MGEEQSLLEMAITVDNRRHIATELARPTSSRMTLEEITRLAAEVAVMTATEYIEKERERAQKARRDWRLHNTKLLLRNYRSFVIHCEDIKLKIDGLDPELLNELDSDVFAIEAIKQSKAKTLVFVNFIQQMMLVYRILCERSGASDDMRRYKTIEMMYIGDQPLSADEIAEIQNIDRRTVYKDINRACETLSTLMFGVDGARLTE